ncbi:TetR/AcrR family transcriptional regulator [Cumulibacter manganitolerans]|uniref:TetR/AcrR family transcriptional regulator n=1 Tax=Cumulibacter manganitolerans TaxID=1884992 RepID=UPI0012979626|nr:TetR/AcrR family transcriptional regulator [Cumulibacter manganitolerans]
MLKDRRRAIADAASQVFAEAGYAQASITAIADASGVTRPTIYTYFESKYDILRAVAEQVRDEVLQAQENVGEDPEEILRTTTSANLRQRARHYGVLTVIQHEALSDPVFERLLDDVNARAMKRHRRFIERLQAQGRARPLLTPEAIVEINLGTTQRMAQLVWRDPAREEWCAEVIFQSLTQMINLVNDPS